MGCDIHLYVEHRSKHREDYWEPFGGRFNPGRNYGMFALLANVRTEDPIGINPRGLPENLAFDSRNDNFLYISEDGSGGSVTLETAKRYEAGGSKIVYINGQPHKVSHPDWHSHSWLSGEEFEAQVQAYNEKHGEQYPEPEYNALVAAIKSLRDADKEVRVVFWFDN